MNFLRIGGAMTAALALASANPAHAEWLEARSAHFTVYGNMSEADLKTRTLKLERFDALMRKLFAVGDVPNVTVYELGDAGQVQALLGSGSGSVFGFYKADADGAKAFVPDRLPDFMSNYNISNPQQILFHEYTHHVLLSNVSVWMPSWAQEGLAEMFSTATLDKDGGITVGAKPDGRRFDLFGMGRWPVARMLDANAHPGKYTKEEFAQNYSMGWAVSHYLWLSGNRPGQFTAYIEAINAGGDQVESGKKVFGDLGKFDSEIDRYVNVGKFKFSRFTAAQLAAPTQVAIRKLGEGETAMLPFRIRSTNGVDEKSAVALANKARPVGARFPNDLIVQRQLTEIEYDAKNYDAAEAASDRALAIDPKDLRAMLYKGRVAARRAVAAGPKGDWRTARQWFLKANGISNNEAMPFVLYYDSFTAAGIPASANAIAGLNRALQLVPEDQSIRIRAALEALRAGQAEQARGLLAPVLYAGEGASNSTVGKLIQFMDTSSDAKAVLAKAVELKLDRINEFVDPPKDDEKSEK